MNGSILANKSNDSFDSHDEPDLNKLFLDVLQGG